MDSAIEIIKPKVDKRSYKYFKLENGLRCMLIHDPEGDKSAASIDVRVGASLDPREYPGTAHFLEHMLFQGTEKYPSENEYSEFMSNNGGMNNAFTSKTNTNYHFECSNEAFEEGFDRLAQFFICPKFSKNSAEREVNAVDSEYNMSLQVDSWHQLNLHQSLSNKESNYNKFMCGNKESLDKDEIREVLLDYHKKWYSANIMCVTMSSKNTLEDMTKWATEKLSPIKNFNVEVPNLMDPQPFGPENQAKLVRMVPIKDVDELSFIWIMPYAEKDIKHQPLSYFSHLFGHEGENSILSWLKNEGLALSLSAGGDHDLWGFSKFQIVIKLTKKGLEQYETVIESVFNYAKNIQERGPQEYVFKECKNIGQMSFEFSDKGGSMSTVVSMSRRIQMMPEEEMSQILRSRYVADEYDPELIKKTGELLTHTDNVIIFMKSKSFDTDESIKLEVEKWYKTKHLVADFSPSLLKKMTEPNCDQSTMKLNLPPENTLIPENLDVLPANEELAKTHLLKRWEDTDLWYMKDDKFDRPKSYIYMKIYTGDDGFGRTIEKKVFAQVWEKVVEEFLREYSYMADCARMGFSMAILHDNINLTFNGFNDKMPTYIVEIITRILKMKEANLQHTFENVKEKVLLAWKNFYLDQTFRQIMPAFRVLLYENSWEQRQQREILDALTFEQFQEQLSTWLKGGQYVFYVYGNYEPSAAIDLVEKVRGILNLNLTPLEEMAKVDTLILQPGQSVTIWDEVEDKTNDNSCVVTYYQLGPIMKEYKRDLCLKIITQYLNEPFFDDLRTKQQLGYVVAERYSNERGVAGCWFLVQSAQKGCEYLVSCINKFLMDRRKMVSEMTEEQFQVQKKSVRTQLAEQDKNMSQQSGRFWGEISTHNYDFERQDVELKLLEEITLADFKALWEYMFFSEYSKRLDFELTSVKHKYNQAEWMFKNSTDPYFTQHLQRTVFPGNISDFKKQAKFRSDNIKESFIRWRGGVPDGSKKPVLGYWGLRGFGAQIRYQLKYCGVEYTMQNYTKEAPQQWFENDKKNFALEFPNLPYFFHGDTKLTETRAIMHYIAEVWDQSLLGKNAQEKATVEMLLPIVTELRIKVAMACYKEDDKGKVCEEYKEKLPPLLSQLGSNAFLVGANPTTVDFAFYELVQLLHFVSDGAVFTEHPTLVGYCERFKALKGVKEYFADPFAMDKGFVLNSWISKVNGTQDFK